MEKALGINAQKAEVAKQLLIQAGNMVEFWTELFENKGGDPPCDAETARKYVAVWLSRLPGDYWDIRLGDAE